MYKKIIQIILLNLCLISCISAQSFKLFNEASSNGYIIYATNNEPYPISVSIDFTMKNLIFSEGTKKIFIIPAQTEKLKVGELTIATNKGAVKFSMKYTFTMGDVTISNYDKTYLYDLPFQKGQRFNLSQGYNGKFSHFHENALDFTMPEGTEIVAAREGKIVEIVQHNSTGCPTQKCNQYNNYVTVIHPDGTFASYIHIQKNSVKHKIGDTISKGDWLANSGNTGWSNGPHLHFVCFIGAFGERKTIETAFKINIDEKIPVLKEGVYYKREY